MVGAQVEDVALGQDPVFLPGIAGHWPALQLWRGPAGLSRLTDLCGTARVQVMISRQQRFVGDMQHLMLLECSFAEFLGGTLDLAGSPQPSPMRPGTVPDCAAPGLDPKGPSQLFAYLAQCPICVPGSDRKGLQPGPLRGLLADIDTPQLLHHMGVSQVNFWASPRRSQSSLHYDPYSNLLVVAQGCKTVRLVPPSAMPLLAPQPIYHESANHSPADLAALNTDRFPALSKALPGLLETFSLQPGDGLYIPEGWWHQVESEEGTLAVNFWWESDLARAMGGCMDRYYFRRLAQSLLEQEKQRRLAAVEPADLALIAQALPRAPTAVPACLRAAGTTAPAPVHAPNINDDDDNAVEGQQADAGCRSQGQGAGDGVVAEGWLAGGLSAPEQAALQAIVSLAAVAAAGKESSPGKVGEAAPGPASVECQCGRGEGGQASPQGGAVSLRGRKRQHAEPWEGHTACQQQSRMRFASGHAQQAQHVAEGLIAALAAEPQVRPSDDLPRTQAAGHDQQAAPAVQPSAGGTSLAGQSSGSDNPTEAPRLPSCAPRGTGGQGRGFSGSGAVPAVDACQAPPTAAAATAPPAPAVGASQPLTASATGPRLARVLLALREQAPSALRWLLLEGLSPAAWEMLLTRLEQAEEQEAAKLGLEGAHQNFAAFYDHIYSVCGADREALLAVMLSRKQQFAEQALRGVLKAELGVLHAQFA
ncbi:hypothetical protein N2152v2_004866 [Parachlorella kessleri]